MARGKDKNKEQEQNKGATESMRLDKYLKVSRIIKRRTVAGEACDGGRDYCITVCAHCSSVPSLISLYMPFASDLSTCSDSVTTS